MKIAFDARAWTRPPHSYARVLKLLVAAAGEMKWAFELWADKPLRQEYSAFGDYARTISGGKINSDASVVWSPGYESIPSGMPFVATIHDVNPLMPDGRPVLQRFFRSLKFRYRAGRTLRLAHAVATDSEYSLRQIRTVFGSGADKVRVVPYFVDPMFKPVDPVVAQKGIATINLKKGYVLFLGSLRRHKNWQGLMRAFAALPARLREEHPLVLAGPVHRDMGNVRNLAASLGIQDHIHVPGTLPDDVLPALYTCAAVFAFPSFLEGFGLPPLEAMACGTPVVASDCTSLPEVLGDAPLYVTPDNIQSISAALERSLSDGVLRKKLIDGGFRRVHGFTALRTGKAMQDLIAAINR